MAVAATTVEETARAIFAAVAAKDAAALHELIHPDLVEDYLPIGRLEGREAVLRLLAEIWSAAPDAELRVEQVVADGQTAFGAWHWEGTFTGTSFQGIRATGDRVVINGVDRMEIEGGLLRRNTVYYDGAEFARAIGMLPARGSAADRSLTALFNARTGLRRALRR